MALYRIRIQILSPLVTPLKGDTIWGHVVWGIANHEGENAVGEFLAAEKKETPLLVVSSAFPAGFVCRPLPLPQKQTRCLSRTQYAEIKQKKKDRFVPASRYLEMSGGNKDMHSFCVKQMQELSTHNTINRLSGTVSDGNLYSVPEYWFAVEPDVLKPCFFDLYVQTTIAPLHLKELFVWAFENGYGADASTGKGHIVVSGYPEEVLPKYQVHTYMALAPFVLNAGDGHDGQQTEGSDGVITDLRADLFVRTGKIGGGFSGSSMSPYKKTVVMFDEGAVFTSERPINFVGCLLQNIHSDKHICQSGFAPVIPVTVEDKINE